MPVIMAASGVIAELLGVPEADQPLLRPWSQVTGRP
jgi:hypothetical protein